MLEPIDIAIEIHKLCEEKLIPSGFSPNHTVEGHAETTSFYAKYLNGAGVQATGKEVVEAIFRASGWDGESPWPGHPHPDLVIAELLT